MTVTGMMAAAVAFTNLLFNADFGGDGIGGVLGWDPWNPASRLERPAEKGPDGAPALRLVMPKGDYMMQHDLKLVEGEEYEAGAWVKTRQLTNSVKFLYCNMGWYKDGYSPAFPRDTAGAWKKVTWRFRPAKSVSSYRFAFAGATDGGELLFSGLYLTPVTAKGLAGSGRYLTPKAIPSRIVPVAPRLAEVDRDRPEIEFHYNGDLDGEPAEYEFAATVDDGKTWVTAQMGANRRGRVKFAPLRPAWRAMFPLKVAVRRRGGGARVHENDYVIRPPAKVTGPAGRKLNNFVTELLSAPAADGTVKFFNPRKGWVFIGLDRGDVRTEIALEPMDLPIVRWRAGERFETMRFLDAGWKTLRLAGVPAGARLDVRAVKRIVHAAPWMERGVTDLWRWTVPGGYWKSDFTKRYLFPFFNTASFYGHTRTGERNVIENAYYEERGLHLETIININPRDLARNDAERSRRRLLGNSVYREGRTITIDESGVMCTTRDARVNFAEAMWGAADGMVAVNNFYCDATENLFDDPASQTTELAAIVNTGRGEGMIYPEAYVAGLKDPVAAHAWEEHFIRWRQSIADLVPAAADRILWYIGTFIETGMWCDWAQPEADMKVLYSDLIRRIATDPAFGEPGGIAAGYFHHTDDDVARWLAKAVRHYCIEGATDDLAERWGFRYLPGIVRNADFAEGLKGWRVEGDVKPFRHEGYGKVLGRKKAAPGVGDDVALFTRGDRPNRLSQRLTGLTPGRYYHIHFVAADMADVKTPLAVTNGTFLARGVISDGGEAVPELCGVHVPNGRLSGRKVPYLVSMMMVFKATAAEATYTITDWRSDAEPGAEKGRQTMVNYVNARPYYLENDEELEFLKARGRASVGCLLKK